MLEGGQRVEANVGSSVYMWMCKIKFAEGLLNFLGVNDEFKRECRWVKG